MKKTIQQLTDEFKAAAKAAQDIAETADKDGRDFTDEERATVQVKVKEAADLATQLKAAKADKATRAAIADLDGIGFEDEPKVKTRPDGRVTDLGPMTLGEHFVQSDQFQDLLAQKSGDLFSKEQRVAARPVGYKDLLLTGGDRSSAGGLVQTDYRGLQLGIAPFQRPLNLRSLVTSATTNSDSIEYSFIAGVNLNPEFVAESTTTATPDPADATTGVKPQSGFTTLRRSTTVKTIAHWMALTKRALSDVAQVRTLIDALLRYGLEDEIDRQILNGDGEGENLLGLANTSGLQKMTVDPGAGGSATVSNLEAIRRAKTKIRLGARAVANGVAINPLDLEEFDLIRDNEGRYILGGPVDAGGTESLWRLPVIQNEEVPQGKAYVGDYTKAILYDREQASITVTDSHADFFTRNLVAVLAETRVALAVIQPSAFVEVSFAA